MGATIKRITDKDPAKKLAIKRLTVLELAEKLGCVSEACRRSKMDRTSFYEWKRRFQTHGLDGLVDMPPIHKSHPQTTSPEVVEKILAASMEHPGWGCVKLSDWLKLQGVSVSSPTIQNILIKNNLGSKYERLLKIEERHLTEGIELTPAQVEQIEKANPCFKERHVESSRPGELLCQDTFYIGRMKGVGRVYMQAVVDSYNSFAFGFVHTGKLPVCAVAILHNDVLPFYTERDITIDAILTDNGREFCGTDRHFYEIFLEAADIEHRRTRVRTPKTNGFVERFNGTVLEEFFRKAFRENFYESVEALQSDLDEWLKHYNYERPHRGYRNMGKRPIDGLTTFLADHSTARHQG